MGAHFYNLKEKQGKEIQSTTKHPRAQANRAKYLRKYKRQFVRNQKKQNAP